MSDIIIRVSADDQASDKLRNLTRDTDRLGKSWESFKDTVGNMAGAAAVVTGIGVAVWEAAEAGEALRDLGVQYDTYLSALDRDANMAERLRETTHGIVDDATLMRSAVDAYRLAGAKTEDQILELINIGSTLGGGTAGVEALIGVLRQGSSAMEVLDTAGLSAGNVRQRWIELKETMKDSDEAFRLAVLQEGRAQLDQFGEGLANQASAIEVWKARFVNAFNSALEATAAGVEWWLDNALNPLVDAANSGFLDEILTEILTGESALESIQAQMNAGQMRSAVQEMAADFTALNTGLNQSVLFGGNTEFLFSKLTEAALEFEETIGRAPQSVAELEDAMQSIHGTRFSFGNTDELAADFFIGFRYQMEREAEEALTSALTNLSMGGAAFGSLEGILGDGIFGNLAEIEQAERLIQSYEVTLARATEDRAAGLITANEFEMLSNLQPMVEGYRQQITNANAQLQMHADITRGVSQGWRTATGFISEALDVAERFVEGDTLLAQIDAQASTISSAFETLGAEEIGGITLFSEDSYNQIATLSQQFDGMVEQAEALNEVGLISDEELSAVRETAAEMTNFANEAERGAAALKDMTLDQLLGVTDGGAFGELGDLVLQEAQASGMSDAMIDQLRAAFDEESGRSTEASRTLMEEQIPLILAAAQTNSTEAATAIAMEVLEGLASNAAGLPVEWSQEGFTAVQDNIATPMADAEASTIAISENLAALATQPTNIGVVLDIRVGDNLDTLAAALMPYIRRGVQDNGGRVPGEDVRRTGGPQ